jgi:hypothetical protein
VRDHTISKHTPDQLQVVAREFVTHLLAVVEEGKGQETILATLTSYCRTSLVYHCRSVLKPPFAEDSLAQALMLHEMRLDALIE